MRSRGKEKSGRARCAEEQTALAADAGRMCGSRETVAAVAAVADQLGIAAIAASAILRYAEPTGTTQAEYAGSIPGGNNCISVQFYLVRNMLEERLESLAAD